MTIVQINKADKKWLKIIQHLHDIIARLYRGQILSQLLDYLK